MKTREELVKAEADARVVWASAGIRDDWDDWLVYLAAMDALEAYDKENT
jgi:hypothetical protein